MVALLALCSPQQHHTCALPVRPRISCCAGSCCCVLMLLILMHAICQLRNEVVGECVYSWVFNGSA